MSYTLKKKILISMRGIFIMLGVTPPCNYKAEQNQNNSRISFGHISPKRLEISSKNILVILVVCLFRGEIMYAAGLQCYINQAI